MPRPSSCLCAISASLPLSENTCPPENKIGRPVCRWRRTAVSRRFAADPYKLPSPSISGVPELAPPPSTTMTSPCKVSGCGYFRSRLPISASLTKGVMEKYINSVTPSRTSAGRRFFFHNQMTKPSRSTINRPGGSTKLYTNLMM